MTHVKFPAEPMNIRPEIAALVPEMQAWRHHLHAYPETAFEETATAAFVERRLAGDELRALPPVEIEVEA